jgi:hypothetical protein
MSTTQAIATPTDSLISVDPTRGSAGALLQGRDGRLLVTGMGPRCPRVRIGPWAGRS